MGSHQGEKALFEFSRHFCASSAALRVPSDSNARQKITTMTIMSPLRCVFPRIAAKIMLEYRCLHTITPSEALIALQSFISRLEEPTPHRKPLSRADVLMRRSTLQGLASLLSSEYAKLPFMNVNSKERANVLTLLATQCGSSEQEVTTAVEHYQQHSGESSFNRGHLLAALRQACTPRYDRLFTMLLEDDARKGMQFLVSLRKDLIFFMKSVQSSSPHDDELLVHLRELDSHMKNLFSAWFGQGLLDIQRITYEGTSAAIIEKIATSEAVHPVRSLEDLRTRLGDDHRVYCAFHPLLPDEPLVFCHVALRPTVSSTMKDVLETHHNPHVTTAVFYSISSTQEGLSGVDLGQFLLKEAISLLQQEFSTLTTFVTLSPIPRFRKWLQDKIVLNQGGTFMDDTLLTEDDMALLMNCFGCSESNVLETFLKEMEDPTRMMERYADDLQPLLMKLAARYLLIEKHHGKPLDGVAKFHVRNGAEMYQLNYLS